MGNLSRVLADGRKILLSRAGKRTCIQILDKSDNLVFVRNKAIKTVSRLESKPTEVRTSIGFLPQQLPSHQYDGVRRQIGFMRQNQTPEVYKVDGAKTQITTISKTDLSIPESNITITNTQRVRTPDGKIRTTLLPETDKMKLLSDEQLDLIKWRELLSFKPNAPLKHENSIVDTKILRSDQPQNYNKRKIDLPYDEKSTTVELKDIKKDIDTPLKMAKSKKKVKPSKYSKSLKHSDTEDYTKDAKTEVFLDGNQIKDLMPYQNNKYFQTSLLTGITKKLGQLQRKIAELCR